MAPLSIDPSSLTGVTGGLVHGVAREDLSPREPFDISQLADNSGVSAVNGHHGARDLDEIAA